MKFVPPIRIGASALPALFLALGLCVFGWGLRYKLSLYDSPHAPFHHVASAKLLSKDELPGLMMPVAMGDDGRYAHRTLPFILLLTAMPAVPQAALPVAWRPGQVRTPSRRCLLRRAGLKSFYFRPPPSRVEQLAG